MSEKFNASLERSLKRWQSTDANDTSGVQSALARVYNRLNRPAPFVFWCDSPWQLAVMPFLMRLLCLSPSDTERSLIGQSYEYSDLCRSVRKELTGNLTEDLWHRAFESLMCQLNPEVERALMNMSSNGQDGDNSEQGSARSFVCAELEQRWTYLLPAGGLYKPEFDRSRIAFEKQFRADTGIPIKHSPGSDASLIGAAILAVQFRQQMGDEFSDQICRWLVSSDSWLKWFFGRHPNVFKALLQSDILAIAGSLRRYELVWSSWSNDFLRVTKLLGDPGWEQRPAFEDELIDYWQMLDGAFMYVLEDNVVFACKNPTAIRLDPRGRLHSFTEPAIEFVDGYCMYSWHGETVRAELVRNQDSLTADDIDEEWNGGIRTVLLDRYGRVRHLLSSRTLNARHAISPDAVKLAEDDVGALYTRRTIGRELIAVVKVTNSSPEPDGTYKQYFLRVPPATQTPREGIAWTFGLPVDEYDPDQET